MKKEDRRKNKGKERKEGKSRNGTPTYCYRSAKFGLSQPYAVQFIVQEPRF